MQTPVPSPPELPVFPPGLFEPWYARLPPAVTVIIVLAALAATALVLRPLMVALGRRIEGRTRTGDRELQEELEQLRTRVAELEAVQHRVLELEERVDFAERLLSQGRDASRLPRGT
jgi:Tfp pilus assembly protein PilO